MFPLKTALTATVILASAGLAGCQTTEERTTYYSSAPAPVSSTYVYDDEPVAYRRSASVYIAPSVGYVRPSPVHYVRPPVHYGRPPVHHVRPVTPPPHMVPPPRHYGGQRPYTGGMRPYTGRQPYYGTNGNAPGYDTQ